MGSSITTVFNTLQSGVLLPFYYGLIGLIALIALIILVVELVGVVTSGGGSVEKKTHFKQLGIILAILFLLGFAPGIVNWLITMGGGNIPGVNV